MDEQTALVLALQFVALFSIAGALLLYLLCKIRNTSSPELESVPGGGKPILITSCDNALGLQVTKKQLSIRNIFLVVSSE